MEDPRLHRLANVLVEYSTAVQPGDLVRIAGPPVARELLVAIYQAVLEAGGHPLVQMVPDECEELKLRLGTEEQLRFEDPIAMYTVERIDVSIGVFGADNTKALSQIDPRRQALLSQASKRRMARFLERARAGELRWVGTQFPCHSAAQDVQMSLSAYERFVFRAGLLHLEEPVSAWRLISQRQQRVVDFLNSCHEVRLVTPEGTDLRLEVGGRKWINCDGKENFPDGEVFTGPVEDSAEGLVVVSFPTNYGGRLVDGIRLRFRQGEVVEASADRGQDFLIAMLEQDDGARRIGEIALGTNYAITRYTQNTLFDEKIGGTFHLALGSAYPETGATNQSGLHWDLVCDLRTGGKVFADGQLISRDGRFVDPTWPQPEHMPT